MRREILAIVESGAVIAPSWPSESATIGGAACCSLAKKTSRYAHPLSAGVAGSDLCSYARLTINQPVEFGVAQDDLHVFAGFRERDGLDKLGDLFVVALGFPCGDTVFAGLIRGGLVFGRTGLPHKVRNVAHAYFNVVVGLEEFVLGETDFELAGEQLSGFRKH